MIQTNFINFLKHAGLPKRAWQGHNTSVKENVGDAVSLLKCVNLNG